MQNSWAVSDWLVMPSLYRREIRNQDNFPQPRDPRQAMPRCWFPPVNDFLGSEFGGLVASVRALCGLHFPSPELLRWP